MSNVFTQKSAERWKLQELVEQTGERVVCVLKQSDVAQRNFGELFPAFQRHYELPASGCGAGEQAVAHAISGAGAAATGRESGRRRTGMRSARVFAGDG